MKAYQKAFKLSNDYVLSDDLIFITKYVSFVLGASFLKLVERFRILYWNT